MCMSVCMYVNAYMYVNVSMFAVPMEARRQYWIALGLITDGCKLPRGCWEPNPRPLQEQPVSALNC